MPRELGPHGKKSVDDVKSLGYLHGITDTGFFRSGYNECPGCGGPKGYYAGMCANCRGEPHTLKVRKRQRKQKEEGTYRLPLCGVQHLAKAARDAEPEWRCKNPAGRGTSHPGFGRCAVHGGNSPREAMRALKLKAATEIMGARAAEARRAS
jgi:hypothetical protein